MTQVPFSMMVYVTSFLYILLGIVYAYLHITYICVCNPLLFPYPSESLLHTILNIYLGYFPQIYLIFLLKLISNCTSNTHTFKIFIEHCRDFPGGSVRIYFSMQGTQGSTSGWRTKIPHAKGQVSLHATTREKSMCCNKEPACCSYDLTAKQKQKQKKANPKLPHPKPLK